MNFATKSKFVKWLISLTLLFFLAISSIAVLACYQPNRVELQQQLSHRLHTPVKIQSVLLRWQHFHPHLYLSKVLIESHDQPLAVVKEINLSVNVWQSLLHLSWVLSNVQVQNVALNGIQQSTNIKGVLKNSSRNWRQLYQYFANEFHFRLPQTDIEIAHLSWDIAPVGLKIKRLNVTDLHGKLSSLGYQLTANMSGEQIHTKLSISILLKKLSHDTPVIKGRFNFMKVNLADWKQSPLIQLWLKHLGIHQAVFNAKMKIFLNEHSGSWGVLNLAINRLSLSSKMLPHWMAQGSLGHSLILDDMNAKLLWQQKQNQVDLSAPFVSFNFEGRHYQFHRVALQFLQEKRQWYLKKIRTQHLPMSTLVRWGKYFHLSKRGLQWFEEDGVKGVIDFVGFSWTPSYHLRSLKIRFHQLSWRQYHQIPGVSSIQGDVTLFDKHIQFSFQSKNGLIYTNLLPYWHRYQRIAIQGDAVYFGKNANVNIQEFSLEDSHLNLNLKGALLLRHHHSPHVSVFGQFTFHDVSAMHLYFPRYGLTPKLRAWLKQASLQGDLQNGHILWNGDLVDFPYPKNKGRFVVSAHMKDFHLRFSPAWLPLEHLQGDLSFVNQGLYVRSSSAVLQRNIFTGLKARIKDLNHPRLSLSSQSGGPVKSLLLVLKKSPLPIGKRLNKIRPKGDYRLGLRLLINLNDLNQTYVLGHLAFKHDTLDLPRWNLTLSQVVGMLNFTKHAIWSSSINARFLGSPINMFVKTDCHAGRRVVHLIADGNYTWPSLLGWANLPRLNSIVQGNLFAKINLGLPFSEHDPVSIQIKSPLVGTALSLPAPLLKRSNVPLPFYLKWVSSEKGLSTLVVNLRSKILAKLYWMNQLNSAHGLVQLGRSGSIPIVKQGVEFIGELKKININQWFKRLDPLLNSAQHRSLATRLPLIKANIFIHQISLFGHALKDVIFKADIQHSIANLMVNSSTLNGWVKLPLQQKTKKIIDVKIDYAIWKTKKTGLSTDFNPLTLPPFIIDIRHLRLNHALFSHVHFKFDTKGRNALFHHVLIQSPWYQVKGKARWTIKPNQVQKTTVSGKAFINNLQRLHQYNKFSKLFANGQLGLAFHLSWPAGLLQAHLKQWSGRVVLNGSDGTILVNHRLFHALVYLRMINILGVPSLLQNISTGFNSFWAQGIEFSSLIGDLAFDNGKLNVRKLLIDGQNLKLKLAGHIDLQNKLLNIDLFFNPKLTSSMPLIAGLAGGPLIGAVAWMMDQLVSPVVSKANVQHYQLTGPWQAPKLVKIDPVSKTVSSL